MGLLNQTATNTTNYDILSSDDETPTNRMLNNTAQANMLMMSTNGHSHPNNYN